MDVRARQVEAEGPGPYVGEVLRDVVPDVDPVQAADQGDSGLVGDGRRSGGLERHRHRSRALDRERVPVGVAQIVDHLPADGLGELAVPPLLVDQARDGSPACDRHLVEPVVEHAVGHGCGRGERGARSRPDLEDLVAHRGHGRRQDPEALLSVHRDELRWHLQAGGDVDDVHRRGVAARDVGHVVPWPAQGVVDEEALRSRLSRDQASEPRDRVGLQRVHVARDLARQPPLPGRPRGVRHVAAPGPVVLPVEPEVHVRLIARRLAARPEARVHEGDQRRQALRASELLHRSPHARADLREGGAVEVPLVPVALGQRGQARAVGRLEVVEEVRFVRDDDLPAGVGEGGGQGDELVRERLQIVPPLAEGSDHRVGVPGDEGRVGVDEIDRVRGVPRLGVAADACVAAEERVPLHHDRGAVEAGVPVDLVLAVAQVGDARGAPAHAPPGVLRPGAGPEGGEAQGQRLVLHGLDHGEAQVVAPLELARVVHAPEHGLGGLRAVGRDQGVERHPDVARADARDQPIEACGRLVLLVGPDPERAVGVEAGLVFRRVAGGRVGEVEVVVQGIEEGLPVGGFVGRPEIVGMVIERDVDALLLRGGRRSERQRCEQDETSPRRYGGT